MSAPYIEHTLSPLANLVPGKSNPQGLVFGLEIAHLSRKFPMVFSHGDVLSVDRTTATTSRNRSKNGTLVLAFCWAHVFEILFGSVSSLTPRANGCTCCSKYYTI